MSKLTLKDLYEFSRSSSASYRSHADSGRVGLPEDLIDRFSRLDTGEKGSSSDPIVIDGQEPNLDMIQSKIIKRTIETIGESIDDSSPITMVSRIRTLLTNQTSSSITLDVLFESMNDTFREFFSDEEKDYQLLQKCNYYEELCKWVTSTNVEDLAKVISTTPSIMEAMDNEPQVILSPYQRLLMAVYVNPPFTVTSNVSIDMDDMLQLSDQSIRANPVSWTFKATKGETRNLGFMTLDHGFGKTAIGLGIGIMLATEYYDKTVQEYMGRHAGSPLSNTTFARLVVVSTGVLVRDQFIKTATRMKNSMKTSPYRIEVWDELNYPTPPRDELNYPTTPLADAFSATSRDKMLVIVLVVDQQRLSTLLADNPEIGIVFLLYDDMRNVPNRRNIVEASAVIKTLVLQAAPGILATLRESGNGALVDFVGKKISKPNNIVQLVQARRFKEARIACRALCQINLVFTNEFRALIQHDLRHLFPEKILYIPVKSNDGRRSLANYITGEGDMAPSNLRDTLAHVLNKSEQCNGTEFMEKVFSYMTDGETVDMRGLIDFLNTVQTIEGKKNYAVYMARRLEEFSNSCPICFDERPLDPKIRCCCGWATCEKCYDATPYRCPFCRFSNFPSNTPATPHPRDTIFTVLESAVFPTDTIIPSLDFVTQGPTEPSSIALLRVMLYLGTFPRSRVLIMINIELQNERSVLLARILSRRISEILFERGETRTSFNVATLDNINQGRQARRKFATIKEEFDGPGTTHMALIASGPKTNINTGMDLAMCESIIVIGSVGSLHVSNAISRVFRPRITSGPPRSVALFNISSFPLTQSDDQTDRTFGT